MHIKKKSGGKIVILFLFSCKESNFCLELVLRKNHGSEALIILGDKTSKYLSRFLDLFHLAAAAAGGCGGLGGAGQLALSLLELVLQLANWYRLIPISCIFLCTINCFEPSPLL